MTDPAIADQISAMDALFKTAQRLLGEGKDIDLGGLEKMAGRLHETIANRPRETGGTEASEIKSSIRSIIEELTKLEDRLMQHKASV